METAEGLTRDVFLLWLRSAKALLSAGLSLVGATLLLVIVVVTTLFSIVGAGILMICGGIAIGVQYVFRKMLKS